MALDPKVNGLRKPNKRTRLALNWKGMHSLGGHVESGILFSFYRHDELGKKGLSP